jgi:hypothetical protein
MISVLSNIQGVYNCGDILKIGKWFFFQVLRVSCVLQELKFLPKFLSYHKDHLWGAATVLR